MPTDTNTLMDEARCIDHCIPDGFKLSVLIAIFAEIANMPTDTNTLIEQAKCIQHCIPPGMELAVLIYLADQIRQNGTGGAVTGTGQCGAYGGLAPNFTPTGGCGWAIDTDTGKLWWYYSGTWAG